MSKLGGEKRRISKLKRRARKGKITPEQQKELDDFNSKLTKEQQGALDSFHETGSPDHYDYDMGDYEKSYK